MPAPSSNDEFLNLVRASGLVDADRLADCMRRAGTAPSRPNEGAEILIRDGLLTPFQAEHLLQGKWRRFTIGKCTVLDRLGSGDQGSVFLCTHTGRAVAVKVLPTALSGDERQLHRFYRQARALASLHHVNIVRAYDVDQDNGMHYTVMEFVDGANLQQMVERGGLMNPVRAAHYISQAALGLQHLCEQGLAHREIEPGNIMVERHGAVKIVDFGLVRFISETEEKMYDQHFQPFLDTVDYVAPEQAVNFASADIRADIYGLGATLHYLLSGRTIFGDGTVAQKLMWHLSRQPKLVSEYRPEVPAALAAIVQKMLAKDPGQRYPAPMAVVEALTEWTRQPIPPPPENEMPQWSPAVRSVVARRT
jgi:serine/threonine protein kinase